MILLLINLSLLVAAARAGGPVVQPEVWCVARNDAEDAALQSAIGWACGPGGSDCGPIQQGGPCYDPTDIQQTASYAFNDYFLKHGPADDACFFDNSAALTSLDPSHGSCRMPSSKTLSNSSVADTTATQGTGPAYADLSGSSRISITWIWPVIVLSHMLVIPPMIHN